MSFTVKEVLQMDAFAGCTTLTGEAGLNNQVRWVNILEILDDLRYIEEGDFLITTAYDFDFQDTEKQERLIELFAGTRLAALAVQTGHYIEALPPALINRAREHGFPLIEIPPDTSFKSLTKAIISELMRRDSSSYPDQTAGPKKDQLHLIRQHRAIMQKLLAGENAEGLREHLRPLHISAQADYYLFTVSAAFTGGAAGEKQGSNDRDLLEQSLFQLLAQQQLPFLIGRQEMNLVGLVQPVETTEEDIASQLGRLLQELSQLYPRFHLAAGMSQRHGRLEEIGMAQSEARRALEAAELGLTGNSNLLLYNKLGPYRLILEVQNLEVLQAAVADTIGPLIHYDRRSGGDLALTLEIYLKHLNISTAAAELFVHRHTLRYRLRQIEELTGLNFENKEHIFQLFLAMKVYRYLQARKLGQAT